MNKIFKFFSLLSIVAILITSCSPKEYDLANKNVKTEDLVEGIAFKIEHDASNPNIIYLKSLMGSEYTCLWDHPQGRSQEQNVTLEIPFAGTYKVQYGIETRGGTVWSDTVTFTVDNMYAEFVSGEMWTLISGGAGNEKTWYLDLDAEGTSRYFKGPMYFFSNWYTWDGVHNAKGDNYIDAETWDWESAILPTLEREGKKASGAPIPKVQAWIWPAEYKGNEWMVDKADFGSMTFNLKNGANVTVDQESYNLGLNKGSYMLDIDNHMIKFSDARPLHDTNRDKDDVDWYNIRIMYLTKDAMQLGVFPHGDAASMVVYNYISKDYKDNWVPGEVKEPEPTLPSGWESDISQTVSNSVKWVLSPTTPFNWAHLDGSSSNPTWTSPEKYDSWTGFTADAAANYSNFSLTLNSDDKSATYVNPDGTTTKGSYTLDEKGVYTFADVSPKFVICGGWVTLETTSDNQWRITNIEKDAAGKVTGMWVGKRDAVKPEYIVYHLIPQLSSAPADPLTAWKKALVGKTFKPDVNWFVDWLNFDLSGGWSSASSFGTDYITNNWVWTLATRTIAESASLKFEASGNDVNVTLTQDLKDADGNTTTAGYTITGKVVIDTDVPSMKFEFPLVNYTGSPGAWLNTDNTKGINWTTPLAKNEWIFVSHGGSTLSNIDTNGFWLGAVSGSTAAGDNKDEILGFHYVLAQ